MHYSNIKILVVVLVACISLPYSIIAQIEVISGDTQPYTPTNIIEDVFLGSGLEIKNIQYQGSDEAVGIFNNAESYIGLEHGLILSTGFAASAAGVNDLNTNAKGRTSYMSISDDDLQELSGSTDDIVDIAKYEITFIPESDTIQFRYVFASEEYPDFVCSNFNDVFGFFITGENPDGGNYDALNIARVPDPSDPTGTTFLNNNVAINSVNSGTLGTFGSIDEANCSGADGSLNFSQYYNLVDPGDFPVYNAYLNVFIAQAVVKPCTEYTIKLAIGDAKDDDFDSVVFLEAASFYAQNVTAQVNTISNDGAIAEGCESAEVQINMSFPAVSDTEVFIEPLDEGQFSDQARNNVDFTLSTNNVVIEAGQSMTSFTVEALEDGNDELDEFIYLELQSSVCRTDTIKIKIRDNDLPQVILPVDTVLCENDILRIFPTFNPERVVIEPQVFTNENILVMEESGEVYASFISVQGVESTEVNNSIYPRVCIDSLVSRNMTDVDIFLVSPQGQMLELSTNNGLRDKPSSCVSNPNGNECIDKLINTCFTSNAALNVNNGSNLIGPVYAGNNTYTGSFLPEGNWSNVFQDNMDVNGSWQLLVKSDSITAQDITSQHSFLGSWSIHFESLNEYDFDWSPNFNIIESELDPTTGNIAVFPDDDVTYFLDVTDSYGCLTSSDIRITSLDVSETPEIVSCVGLSPSSVQITWNDAGTDVEYYQVSVDSSTIYYQTSETTFVFEGLESDTEHIFYVSAYNGECFTALDSEPCSTLPCTGIAPSINSITTVPPTCAGRNDGQIFAQATSSSGGELTYYVEDLFNNNGEFNFLVEGEYDVRIVDEFGCSVVETVIVSPAQDVEFEVVGPGISCVGESDAIAEIVIVNMVNPPYTILWQDASEDFTQEELGMGTYFFTITDGGGCKYEKNIEIRDPLPLGFENINVELPNCYGDEGSIELTMSGGTSGYTYDWADTSVNEPLVNFFPGNYSVTVSDANGCSVETEIEMEERLQINLVPDTLLAACQGEASQEIQLEIEGGTPSFDVQWNSLIEGVEVEDVPVGFYELTITDANDCVIIDSIEILNYPDLIEEFDLRIPECFNIEDGIISLASTTYTDGSNLEDIESILWETGSTDEAIGNLLGDESYAYTITDSFGCKHLDSVYLASPPTIFINFDTISLLDCFGDTDASFNVSPAGGTGTLNVEWSPNITNINGNTVSGLGVGSYWVEVIDGDSCMNRKDFDVAEPSELLYNPIVKNVACFNDSNGEIVGEIQGGQGPYTVLWSTGETTESLTGLDSGSFTITVTDNNGCIFQETYEITQPAEELLVAFEAFQTKCFEDDSGSIDITVSGGTMPYTIFANDVNYFDNTLVTGLASGFYNLRVIDAGGCEVNVEDVFIEEADEVYITLPADTTVAFGSSITLDFETNSDSLVEFFWTISTPEIIASCIDCPNPFIEEVTTSFFVMLDARDVNNCKYASNKRWIYESDDSFVAVPKAFSPNGDNRNDVLRVFGKNGVEIMNFEVFDRWGELLHSESDFMVNEPGHSWDGTLNGEEVDSGVYVWKIQLKKISGDVEFLQGDVTLLR